MPNRKYYYDIGDRVHISDTPSERSNGVIVDEDVLMGGIAYLVRLNSGREVYFRSVRLTLLPCIFKEV